MNKQKEYFTKEIETEREPNINSDAKELNKDDEERTREYWKNRASQMKERISKLEIETMQMTQEEEGKLRVKRNEKNSTKTTWLHKVQYKDNKNIRGEDK